MGLVFFKSNYLKQVVQPCDSWLRRLMFGYPRCVLVNVSIASCRGCVDCRNPEIFHNSTTWSNLQKSCQKKLCKMCLSVDQAGKFFMLTSLSMLEEQLDAAG